MIFSKLKEVCTIIAGQSPPSSTYNKNSEGLPFFQGKTDFGELNPQIRLWCSKPKKIAEVGDILISVRAPVGPTNVCNTKSCIGRGLSAIRVGPKLNSTYFLFYLRSIEKNIASIGKGSTFKAITQKDLAEIQIPIPSMNEQLKVVKTLSEADKLSKKRKQSIKLLDEYLKSVFFAIIKEEKTNEIGFLDLFDVVTGKLNANAANNNGLYPFYTCSKEDNFKINTYAFDCEALILSGNNANAEYSVKHYSGKFNAYQRTYILTLKNKYSYYFFREALENKLKILQKSSIGSNTKYLTMGIFKRISFAVPSIESQIKYENFVKKIYPIKQKMYSQFHEMEKQFQALMQKSFNN